MITINSKQYKINNNEYKKIHHAVYNYLHLYEDIGEHERIIQFIKKCKNLTTSYTNLVSFNTSHGGFIPINLSDTFDKIFINADREHIDNINHNILNFNMNNVSYLNNVLDNCPYIFFIQNSNNMNQIEIEHYLKLFNSLSLNLITICKNNKLIENNILTESTMYKLTNTEYYIYVNNLINDNFIQQFKYYMNNINNINNDLIKEINFDNLINLCIMVKNGGPQFEHMLLSNLHIIDKWTILDTGSTDDTISIIQRVLVGKKDGNLYQEPFINFRDSRNRLLDLAGQDCKYLLMLDDTYTIEGNLREFLNEIRSDQYATSYTLFIKSDDTKYGSNRITKSNSGLRYKFKIHEVINDMNNINVIIPEDRASILDNRYDYMEKRTMERKQLDLKLLYEEVEDDPNEPRNYYYLGQTYNLMENYEKAFYYFTKRCEFVNSGFIQERVDAAFERARLANFKLNYDWNTCEELYLKAFKIDETRPESLYFIGVHYYLENNYNKAYRYLKQSFEIGFPSHCQYSLKPTLSFHFLPKFLAKTCYFEKDYMLGEKSCLFFLQNNSKNADDYKEIVSWYQIYQKLNIYSGIKKPTIPEKPIFCFVADGGFNSWSGSTILTSGVGGSETFIIEMARYIQKCGLYDVYVFCNTPEQMDETFEGVNYRHLNKYYEFIYTTYVKHCFISRFSEYIPVSCDAFTENVYFILHDLLPSGIIIPRDSKLKQIFCLTEWHVNYFTNIFGSLKNITYPLYYGIDNKFKTIEHNNSIKIKNKFIYSSFPNRGLLQLLRLWPRIYNKYPTSTLHIYSNVDNKWSNDVEPEKMMSIKNLLNEYKTCVNGLGIYYHGWVDKTELAEAWMTSDIWFYPCSFMETFCLTALEAASSKTLCVTNNLAALQNTVGNRGVIIEGDPTTEIWQENALQKLFYYMDEKNKREKEKLLTINYEWANTLSWEKQSRKLLETYIFPNDIYEYKGMYNWTNDLPGGSKEIFVNVINYFNNNYEKVKMKKNISVLEIGIYTGMSLIEIVKLIPNSYGTGIDMWTNYNENELLKNVDNFKVECSFYNNVKNAGLENRIHCIKGNSTNVLCDLLKENKNYDFIYVDGSHLAFDCYNDLVISWKLLEKGGILAIDDYLYKINDENILNSPYEAVNHFLKLFVSEYKLLHKDYRVFLEKL